MSALHVKSSPTFPVARGRGGGRVRSVRCHSGALRSLRAPLNETPVGRGPLKPQPDNVVHTWRCATDGAQARVDLAAMVLAVERHLKHSFADGDGRGVATQFAHDDLSPRK